MMDSAWGGADHFDVGNAATLFWSSVPVWVKRSDRDDATEELSVRLLSGHTRHNHSLKVLRIHISSDEDLFFLHTLEVSEEDFQALKVEQGILVDFANFSGKIINLLRRCIAAKTDDTPSFRAVLHVGAAESIFKLVETNDFKQLPHISLCFRPGTDLAVKSFLAFRLTEVQGDRDSLRSQLAACSESLQQRSTQCDVSTAELKRMESTHSRTLMEMEARAKEEAAIMLQERVREREELVVKFEKCDTRPQCKHKRAGEDCQAALETLNWACRDQEAVAEKHAQLSSQLQQRVDKLDADHRALCEHKYALEARVAELTHKHASAEARAEALQGELSRAQEQLTTLARDRSEAEVQLGDARGRLSSVTEKASMQERVIEQQSERIHDMEASVKRLEDRCADLREAGSGHEARANEAAAEVSKGNQMIERLTSELQISKDKAKRKQAVITRQEEELSGRDRAIEAADRELQDVKRQVAQWQEEHGRLQASNDELRTKLQDSKEQLKGNEQMIRWLNSQVNEAQMAAARPAVTSRFASYVKPSIGSTAADAGPATYSRTQTAPTGASRSASSDATTPTAFQPRSVSSGVRTHTATPFQPRNGQAEDRTAVPASKHTPHSTKGATFGASQIPISSPSLQMTFHARQE